MLTLPWRSAGTLLVAGDDDEPSRLWVCAPPAIARDADGNPRARLSTFLLAGDVGTAPRSGGRLSLDVDMRPSAQAIAAAGLDPARVQPLPWLDAELEIAGPGFEPLVTEVALAFDQAGAVIDLDAPHAELLAAALLSQAASSLQLTWRGHVRARMPAIEVIATADVATLQRNGVLVGRGRRSLTAYARALVTANAHVEIRGGADAALEANLRQWALDALAERVAQGGSLAVRASASDVAAVPVAATATLEDSVTVEQRQRMVEEVALDPDDRGARRVFEIRPVGTLDALERIDVELEAAGTTARIELVDARARRITVPEGTLQWRRRLVPRGGSAWAWSQWTAAPQTGLAVPAAVPPSPAVEVIAAGFDFDARWRSITIELGVAGRTATVVELGPGHRSARVPLDATAADATAHARVIALAQGGYQHVRELDVAIGSELVLDDPFTAGVRPLALVPAGSGWAEVAAVMVDVALAEADADEHETLALQSLSDFVQWRAPLAPGVAKTARWRRHVSFRDGRFESTAWATTDDEVLVIPIAGAPQRTVQLLPILLDAGVRVRASFASGDVTRELDLGDKTPALVDLPPGRYTLALRWTLPDGSTRTQPPQARDDEVVVVPRPPPQ
ncbi:MAG: hypothetical protein K1X88_12590 [Nannocystaceae bacterium]|nr:hypothetical protein [Nannocystaceae bacterium]